MKSKIKNTAASVLVAVVLMLGAGVVALAPDALVNAQGCDVSDPFGSYECAKPTNAPEKLVGDGGIFQTIANILIFIVGIIAVIMLIIGGIRYAVSGGDDSAVKGAKNTILYAIVGLVVAFLAFALVNFVVEQLEKGTSTTTTVEVARLN